MTTLAQFEAMLPCATAATLYHLLDQAAAERGATRDSDVNVFRMTAYDRARQLIARHYEKLDPLAHWFLVDPDEISLAALRAKNIRKYDLVSLAAAADREFLVPVTYQWNAPDPLVVRHYDWPYSDESLTTSRHARPHLLSRLCGDYFRQAAEMMALLRYYAPTPLATSIVIPECARGNSISHIYAIYIDGDDLDDSSSFRFTEVWNQYLPPGRYYRDFFNLTINDGFSKIIFAGYVDLHNNLQFFAS